MSLVFCQLVLAAAAGASVQLSSDSYQVSQNGGQATITVTRTDPRPQDEYVRYGTHRLDGVNKQDFNTVGGVLHFAPGQTEATFQIPIIPHNFAGPPVHVAVFLYGSWPEALGKPDNATLSILHDTPLDTPDPSNPLELSPAPRNGNVLSGARFYVDRWGAPAGVAEVQFRRSNPAWSRALSVIAKEPFTWRFGKWDGPDPSKHVFMRLEHYYLTDPGAVPLLSTYRLVQGQCARGGSTDSPAEVAAYKRFIDGLSLGVGNFRAVLFLEMDAIITAPCLHGRAMTVRMQELQYAINTLSRNPHLVIYLDGGAEDCAKWWETVKLLRRAGVQKIQGFFLNSTHFDWTTREVWFGQQVAKAIHKHFVVNTGTNGQGPLRPPNPAKQGSEVLCNPLGRGLGPRPTTHTGYKWADAFAWTSNPGERGGDCNGAPETDYWPWYAVGLVQRANFEITGPLQEKLVRER